MAGVGNRPSFAWRSLWQARHVLERGLRWRVGDGSKIRIWGDKWLPRGTTFKIWTPPVPGLEEATVDLLINPTLRCWKIEMINELFWADDKQAILSIPLGDAGHEDIEIWHYTRHGLFDVKSAYYLILDNKIHKQTNQQGSSSILSKDWSALWKLRVTEKKTIFFWRACKDILPTRKNLNRRGLKIEEVCCLCQAEEETTTAHCLFQCPVARQLWAILLILYRVLSVRCESVSEWLFYALEKLGGEELMKFVVGCWLLWFNRNQEVHCGRQQWPNELAAWVLSFIARFHLTEGKVGDDWLLKFRSWSNDKNQWCRVNYDGAFFPAEQASGIGVIARDEPGNCLAWIQRRIEGVLDPVATECIAAKWAIKLAVSQGWNNVAFIGDNFGVVEAIRNAAGVFSSYGTILQDIQTLLADHKDYKFSWTPRDGNEDAHIIAKSATADIQWPVSCIS